MNGKTIKISSGRYERLRGPSWPEYQQYLISQNLSDIVLDQQILDEISFYEYRFKEKVENCEMIDDESYSQAQQDMFVIAIMQGKKNGLWIEFGAADPLYGSNTFFLEKKLDWSGLSIEIEYPKNESLEIWKKRKNTQLLIQDANFVDLQATPYRYDYCSIDIDDTSQIDVLKKICKHHRFSTITFETNWYVQDKDSEYLTKESRKILSDQGYVLLVNGVTAYPEFASTIENRPVIFEDWWVDPEVVPVEIIKKYQWITDDSLDIIKYPTQILFENDPHDFMNKGHIL